MLTEYYTDWKLNPKERKPLYHGSLSGEYNVLAGIQAWRRSTRFPNKIFAQLSGAPLLWHTINKVKLASYISTTLVVTPENDLDLPDDVPVFVYEKAKNKDVLDLYYQAYRRYKPDYIVRVTSDCPVLDPMLVEYIVYQAVKNKADYCSNVLFPLSFPDGQDVEVMSGHLLEFMWNNVSSKGGREHVTLEFRTRPMWHQTFNTLSIRNIHDLSGVKISIDTPEDLKKLESMDMV